jgi:hypothetical protein
VSGGTGERSDASAAEVAHELTLDRRSAGDPPFVRGVAAKDDRESPRGAEELLPVLDVEVDVRLGRVARVPAHAEDVAGPHPLALPHAHASAPQVREQRVLPGPEVEDDVVAGGARFSTSTSGRLSRTPSTASTTTPSAGARTGRPHAQ